MIKQYLSNTNESATVKKNSNFSQFKQDLDKLTCAAEF
jgi:hypothetical protein